ncbi:MAG: response regulator receiver protein [Atopobiaceae bacterium]
MAFDPQEEDYERMVLRFYQSMAPSEVRSAARRFASFGERFAHRRDTLPQTDADRAFHLVSEAAILIDYRLPFAAESTADSLIQKAQKELGEALTLEPENTDASRMLAAAKLSSYEGYFRYLADNEKKAEDRAKGSEERLVRDGAPEEEQELARHLAYAPYLRWLAAEAGRALVCGHYRVCLDVAQHALSLDPQDQAGVFDTAAYAYAKLEDEEGFAALRRRMAEAGRAESAWTRMAALSLAFSRHDLDGARDILRSILAAYPEADEILVAQHELPDGVYARLAVEPGSEDELILAVSEGAILLQEGRDSAERGTLSSWVSQEVPRLVAEGTRPRHIGAKAKKGERR